MTDWNDPLYQKIIAHLPAGSGPGDYVTSLEVSARKAGSAARQNDNRAAQKFGGGERA